LLVLAGIAMVGLVALVIVAGPALDPYLRRVKPLPAAEWRTFDEGGGRFVVELPAEPESRSDVEEIQGATFNWTEWTADAVVEGEGDFYTTVTVFILPQELWNMDDDGLLEAVMEEVRTTGATITEKQFSWTGEYNYRTLDVTARDGSTFYRGKLIYTGSAVYVVETESEGRQESAAHDRVVDSFVLSDPDADDDPTG
jgi:hypothetical protein